MVLRSVERRLEELVEGAFARAFKSGVRPIEIARRLERAVDDNRSVGVSGQTIVPNFFTVALSPEDHANFAEVGSTLRRELSDSVRTHARAESYQFVGPVDVDLVADSERRSGTFRLDARLREGRDGAPPGSLVCDGERIVLDARPVLIGRLAECDIQVPETNVSRHHAEIRPAGHTFVIQDLGSTNGSLVNGNAVTERALRDGDVVTIGTVAFTFEAS